MINQNFTVVNNSRFKGHYYDSKTEFHYNYFRYYSPTIGRYLTPDPIGQEGDINLFAYVKNNPINETDHNGLSTDCEKPKCDQDFLSCMAKCIETLDPLNLLGKGALSLGGASIPKSAVNNLGVRTSTLGGGSPYTTIPSAASQGMGMGAGNYVRTAGRALNVAWLAYGWWMFGVEIGCSASCLYENCSYR